MQILIVIIVIAMCSGLFALMAAAGRLGEQIDEENGERDE